MSRNNHAVNRKVELAKVNELVAEFFENCVKGSESKLKSLLKKKPLAQLINERDVNGRSLLHYCAECSATGCVSALMKHKPSLISEQDKDGYTVLHLAVINGNHKTVSWLCKDARALLPENVFTQFLNAGDSEGHTAYHWAVVCNESRCLDILTDAGASVAVQDIHGAHPIHYAAQMSSPHNGISKDSRTGLDTLKKLLDYPKSNINARDKDGRSPLLWAASSGSTDAVMMLVNAGADLGSKDKDGLTALHCASSRGHIDTVETLLNLCGAEIDVSDSIGCSPLFYAVTLGHADCTQMLLVNGAEPNRQDHKGRTAAHCGAARGQFETIKILSSHGANLWVRNIRGDLPLHEAIKSGRKELVRWLLQQMPSAVNTANSKGRTPLHIAAINNNLEMCKVVIDSGGEINPVMKSNGHLLTPLDAALQRGYRSCAKFFLLHGALPASKLNLNSRTFTQKANFLGDLSPFQEAAPTLNGNMNGNTRNESRNTIDTDTNSEASSGQIPKPPEPKGGGVLSMQRRMQHIEGNRVVSEFNSAETNPSLRSQSIITNVYVTTGGKHSVFSEQKSKQRNSPSSNSSLTDSETNGQNLKTKLRNRSKSQSSEVRSKIKDKKKGLATRKALKEAKSDVDIVVTSDRSDDKRSDISRASKRNKNSTLGSEIKVKKSPKDVNQSNGKLDTHNLSDDELLLSPNFSEHGNEKSSSRLSSRLSRRTEMSSAQDLKTRIDSRCGHRLHYMSILPAGQLDLRHVRPKVDTNGIDLGRQSETGKKSPAEIRKQREEMMERVERSIRRHQMERNILQELQELKKCQIRVGKSNEPAVVKRLADKFAKQVKEPEIGSFNGSYCYANYEKFLYEQLRKLSKSTMRKVLPIIKSSSDENLGLRFKTDQDMMSDPDKYRQISASAMSDFPLYPPTFKEKDSLKRDDRETSKQKKEARVGQKTSEPKKTKMNDPVLNKKQEKRPIEKETSDTSQKTVNKSRNLSQTKTVSNKSQRKKEVMISKGDQSLSIEKDKVSSKTTTQKSEKESKINGMAPTEKVGQESKLNESDHAEKSEQGEKSTESLSEGVKVDRDEASTKEVAKLRLKKLMNDYQMDENEDAQENGITKEVERTEDGKTISESEGKASEVAEVAEVSEVSEDREAAQVSEEASKNKPSVTERGRNKKLHVSKKELAKSTGHQEPFRTTAKFEQYRQMRSSARRSCLKKDLPSKPIEAAINRPKFMRCKSSIPARFKVRVPMDVIKNRWRKIKDEEKRRMSSDSEPESISMLYEINKPKKPLEMIFEEEVETPVEMYRDSLRRTMSDSDIFFRDVLFC